MPAPAMVCHADSWMVFLTEAPGKIEDFYGEQEIALSGKMTYQDLRSRLVCAGLSRRCPSLSNREPWQGQS